MHKIKPGAFLSIIPSEASTSKPNPMPAVVRSPAARLRHHLEEMIQNQVSATDLNEAKLASQLGMSLRSLQRHLRRQGSSYRKLVAKVKCEIACDRLSNSTEPVKAIGEALGFSDSSNFSRAFRRWQGCSPSRYRIERT